MKRPAALFAIYWCILQFSEKLIKLDYTKMGVYPLFA